MKGWRGNGEVRARGKLPFTGRGRCDLNNVTSRVGVLVMKNQRNTLVSSKTCCTATSLHTVHSNTKLDFTHVYSASLRCPLGQRFGRPTVNLVALLGVREILEICDLELPVFLNESDYGD